MHETSEDDCGFVQWRVCVYVVNSLDNFLYLLDQFWTYIAAQLAKETSFDVHLHMAADVNVDDAWDNLTYPKYTLNEPSSAALPVSIYEAPPCFGKRPATWAVELHDSTCLSVVVTQVYPYRDRFEAMGIPGGRVGATDTSKGDFVRLLKHLDVSKEDEGARLKEILDKVLRNVASET